jgi:hypothetical protein
MPLPRHYPYGKASGTQIFSSAMREHVSHPLFTGENMHVGGHATSGMPRHLLTTLYAGIICKKIEIDMCRLEYTSDFRSKCKIAGNRSVVAPAMLSSNAMRTRRLVSVANDSFGANSSIIKSDTNNSVSIVIGSDIFACNPLCTVH